MKDFLRKQLIIDGRLLRKAIILVIIVLPVIGFVTGIWYQASIDSTNETPSQKIVLPTPVINPKILPSSRISILIPTNDNWIKYNATCPGLGDNITVYYPQSWKIGKYGEEKISDGYEKNPNSLMKYNSECQIIFGYPYIPGSHQNSLVDGQRGEIRISSYLAQGKQLADLYEDLYKSEKNSPINDIKNIYITDYANRKWIKTIYFNSASIFDLITLQTVYKNRVYNLSYSAIDEQTLDASSSGHLFAIGEEFVRRLEFH